jgi:hypothetical protein
VILVNLTSGRNPWKQASVEDSTYRAFLQSPGFLKTILPISNELDDILSRIFTQDPEQRITIPELRRRIETCQRFTEKPAPAASQLPTPASSPESFHAYADYDESAIEDDPEEDYDYRSPSSPAASDASDDSTWSDDGSLSSSGSSQCDSDEEDFLPCDIPEVRTPPPQAMDVRPIIVHSEDARNLASDLRFESQVPTAKPPEAVLYQPSPVPAAGARILLQHFWTSHCRPTLQPTPFYQLPALAQGF